MKMIFLSVITTLALVASQISSAADYKFDPVHTQIFFTVSHMGFSNSSGAFREFDGQFSFDETNFENSSAQVTIKTASLDMNDATWNEHLSNEQWFNVKKFPQMTFKSTGVKKTGENTMDVMGELTLLGVTRPVTLKVVFNKAGKLMDKEKAGFSARASVDRTQFGMMTYAPAIGTNVNLHIEVEGFKQ